MIAPTALMESTVRMVSSSLTVMQVISVILEIQLTVMKIKSAQQVIIVLEVLFYQ